MFVCFGEQSLKLRHKEQKKKKKKKEYSTKDSLSIL